MKQAALLALCVMFLVPVGVGELSVNYSFLLYPAAIIAMTGRFKAPPLIVIVSLLAFSLIFAVSALFDFEGQHSAFRRAGSFLVFITIFAFTIVDMSPDLIAAFKRAVVVISVYYSTTSVLGFLGLAAAGPIHFEVKNILGSQRFGFIYIVAFWLALLEPPRTKRWRLVNYGCLGIVTAGLFLTFSRSAIVALAGSLLMFALHAGWKGVWRPSLKTWGALSAGAVLVAGAVAVVQWMFPLTFEFFATSLLRPSMDASLFQSLGSAESSEGIRVVRILESVTYVMSHPLTGTGFLGIWAFSPTGAGSAHNQLLDTFIRVGVFGFALYVYLLYRVVRFLGAHERALFWGVIGVLIYGVFHETFKESQGAFVLAFLMGMAARQWRLDQGQRLRAAAGNQAPAMALQT